MNVGVQKILPNRLNIHNNVRSARRLKCRFICMQNKTSFVFPVTADYNGYRLVLQYELRLDVKYS